MGETDSRTDDAIRADLRQWGDINFPVNEHGIWVRQRLAQRLADDAYGLLARATAAEERIEAALALHQPRRDDPMSLAQNTYCSCGAYEPFIAGDGHTSIGPASWPCATARALGPPTAPEANDAE